MKNLLPALIVCLALGATGIAAEKKTKKSGSGHKTIPPTSRMIVLPPVPQVRDKPAGGPTLITTELGGLDLQFFSTAMESGLMQAFLGDLVKTKGEAERIKAVGSALAATQQEENKQIGRLASLKGVALSTEAPRGQEKISAELEKLSGSNFDKAVMDKIIGANQQAIGAYETAAKSKDGDIKAFSEQMLPIAKEKLRLAEKMTGAGTKAASQLFRKGATPPGPRPEPANREAPAPFTPPPVKPAPAPAPPAGKPLPAGMPAGSQSPAAPASPLPPPPPPRFQ